MLQNMKGTRSVMGVLAVGLFLGGCASVPDTGYDQNHATVVQVQNLNPNRVVIHALSGGIDHRLGEVETTATDDFLLPSTVSLLDLQIVVDPIGPFESYMTRRISAGPGDLVEVTVQPNLDLTTVTVRGSERLAP